MSEDLLGRLRRACEWCGGKVIQPAGRGRSRKYCCGGCANDARNERRSEELEALKAEAEFARALAS